MFHVEQGRRPNDPLSLLTAFAASSPKGTPFSIAANFIATTKSRPLGEGGIAVGDDGRGSPASLTLSVCSLRSQPAPPKGELLASSGQHE